MDFLSGAILSGILYDGFKGGANLTVSFLKESLQEWLFDDAVLDQLVRKLQVLELEELADYRIEKKINESPEILECIQKIKSKQSIDSVIQNHTGSGDNVAGNKIVNNR